MVIYVDVKSGKVDLTKEELDKICKAEYDRGYNAGRQIVNSITYSCPGYWSCPYRSWSYSTTANDLTVKSTSSDPTTITCNSNSGISGYTTDITCNSNSGISRYTTNTIIYKEE